jgi:hypothetical protein
VGRPRLTPQDFWDRVEKRPGGCWLYHGPLDRDGYGLFQGVPAHRWAYQNIVGLIPAGHELDHVHAAGCRHRNCVRPDHLEPVSHAQNSQRAHAVRDSCPEGHPYDRVHHTKRGPVRACGVCAARDQATWRARQSADPRKTEVA